MRFLHGDVSGEENRPVVVQEISFLPYEIIDILQNEIKVFKKSMEPMQGQMGQ